MTDNQPKYPLHAEHEPWVFDSAEDIAKLNATLNQEAGGPYTTTTFTDSQGGQWVLRLRLEWERVPSKHPDSYVGRRVELVDDVVRYPHFVAPKGTTGTVITDNREYRELHVRLDQYVPGAEEWHNELHWWDEDDYLDWFLRDVRFLD